LSPRWSPDGRWILFNSDRSGRLEAWRVEVTGGEPEKVSVDSPNPSSGMGWSSDGGQIYVQTDDALWQVPFDRGHPRKVADLTSRRGATVWPAAAVSGGYLYFAWREDVGDIWVMDVVADGQE
jgi:Tol biopolymer transport system component